MQEVIELSIGGLLSLLTWSSLLWMVAGTALGIIVGVIPGFSSSMAIGILLPVTFVLSPQQALIFLISVYIATIYGGSITAIILNTPGAPESSATVFDGYPMTQQGKGSEALGIAFGSSLVGGLLSYTMMLFLMIPIAWFSLKVGPPEMFLIALLGISVLASLAKESPVKTLLVGFFGLLIGTIGIVPTGEWRATFDSMYLAEGVQIVPAIIGFFALSEIFTMIERQFVMKSGKVKSGNLFGMLKGLLTSLKHPFTTLKSSIIGSIIGAIPAAGSTVAAFTSYGEAKRSSSTPEKFGKGHPEGIIAAESANNASTGGALTTTFALGVPGSATTAVLMGALLMQGLQPGPELVRDQMPLVYTLIIACIVSQLLMLFMSITVCYSFTSLLKVPTIVLAPTLAVFCMAGTFAVRNALFDIFIMILFGVIGWLMKRYGFPVEAIVLGIVLGGIADNELIRTYMRFGDEFIFMFFQRPISLILIIIIVLGIVYPYIQAPLKRLFKRNTT